MGVQGLLLLLKPAITECNLKRYQGQTCVIDVMGWLYRGAFASAWIQGPNGQMNSLGYMGYSMKQLKLLISYDIKPICVFDGRPHEAKMETEKRRLIDKQKNQGIANDLWKQGNVEDARKQSTKSLFIKSKQIDLFQEILDHIGVEHVSAPYEADAQMAYMVREGLANFAITEDSDLIAYGCPKTVLKMNYNGFGQLFDLKAFQNEKNPKEKGYDEKLQTLQKMGRDEFIMMCIMGGCDYSQSIERVGLKTVLKHYPKAGSCEQIIKDFENNKAHKDKVPEGYLESCKKVKTIFKFQTVYDPRTKKFTSLEQPKEGETFDQKYVGEFIDPDDMEDYGTGRSHKKTLQPRRSRINVFDMQFFLRDWGDNCISERSFRCLDLSFFDDTPACMQDDKNTNSTGDQNNMDLSLRHGKYLYSSKDWIGSKSEIMQDEKEAYIKQIQEENKKKTEEEINQSKKNREAYEIKQKVLPTKIRFGNDDDFGFGFCYDENDEEPQALEHHVQDAQNGQTSQSTMKHGSSAKCIINEEHLRNLDGYDSENDEKPEKLPDENIEQNLEDYGSEDEFGDGDNAESKPLEEPENQVEAEMDAEMALQKDEDKQKDEGENKDEEQEDLESRENCEKHEEEEMQALIQQKIVKRKGRHNILEDLQKLTELCQQQSQPEQQQKQVEKPPDAVEEKAEVGEKEEKQEENVESNEAQNEICEEKQNQEQENLHNDSTSISPKPDAQKPAEKHTSAPTGGKKEKKTRKSKSNKENAIEVKVQPLESEKKRPFSKIAKTQPNEPEPQNEAEKDDNQQNKGKYKKMKSSTLDHFFSKAPATKKDKKEISPNKRHKTQ